MLLHTKPVWIENKEIQPFWRVYPIKYQQKLKITKISNLQTTWTSKFQIQNWTCTTTGLEFYWSYVILQRLLCACGLKNFSTPNSNVDPMYCRHKMGKKSIKASNLPKLWWKLLGWNRNCIPYYTAPLIPCPALILYLVCKYCWIKAFLVLMNQGYTINITL